MAHQRQEAQATAAVRVRRHELQLDARHLPQEARPDEQPEIPAQEQELEQRQAHAAQPPTGQRRLQFPIRRHAVPGRHVERHLRPPDEPHPDDVDERDQQHLRRDRIAQAHRRGDGRVELRPRRVRDQAALQELPHHRAHPLVHDQFRHDQQRQRQQQAHVHLHVVEERQLDAPAPGVSLRDRQGQQRHPGQQRQHDDAAAQQLQRVSGQTRPPPELIQRPAEDQREVVRFLRSGSSEVGLGVFIVGFSPFSSVGPSRSTATPGRGPGSHRQSGRRRHWRSWPSRTGVWSAGTTPTRRRGSSSAWSRDSPRH